MPSDTSSRRLFRRLREARPAGLLWTGRFAGLGLFLWLAAAPASAKVFLSVEEALRLAFPDCQVAQRTAFLNPEQRKQAAALAGAEIPSALINRSVATCAGRPGGTAYFDTHRVRTLPETLLVVVDPAGKVARIEVISFREPEDYLPRGPWYAQFLGKGLDANLDLKRSIRPVTGATLTANATLAAVRRILAVHQVLSGYGTGGGHPR